jgi:hypothetical protein
MAELGQAVSCESVCRRFSHWRADIKGLFEADEQLKQRRLPKVSFEDDAELLDYKPLTLLCVIAGEPSVREWRPVSPSGTTVPRLTRERLPNASWREGRLSCKKLRKSRGLLPANLPAKSLEFGGEVAFALAATGPDAIFNRSRVRML